MLISAASKAQGSCPGTAHMLSFYALQPSQDVEDKELLTEAKASALVQVRHFLAEHPPQVPGSEGAGCCRSMASELAVSLPHSRLGRS